MTAKEKEFTRLVKQHKQTIYSICFMHATNKDETQDMMQEALIQLWRSFDTFRGESNIRTWIWRVCSNVCISYCRKENKQASTLHLELADVLDSMESEENKQIAMLHERIHSLLPFDRTIVLLWMECLSYDEIGQILGITTKNVSVRLLRIKEQLRKMSSKEND